LFALALLSAVQLQAAEWRHAVSLLGSTVKVEGTSNLHDGG